MLDLGIDVEPEEIVQKAKENGITIIGLSGVLTLAIDSMKATVEAFAAAGYHLYLTCLQSEDTLLSLKQELESRYAISCHASLCDMGNYQDVAKLFSHIHTLDVLINNAGLSHIGLIQDMSPDQWDRVMATNLHACFYTAKCAIPLMLAKGRGRILNVSSVWGCAGASMEAAYSASKGGVNTFTSFRHD